MKEKIGSTNFVQNDKSIDIAGASDISNDNDDDEWTDISPNEITMNSLISQHQQEKKEENQKNYNTITTNTHTNTNVDTTSSASGTTTTTTTTNLVELSSDSTLQDEKQQYQVESSLLLSEQVQTKRRGRGALLQAAAEQIRENRRRHLQKLRQQQEEEESNTTVLRRPKRLIEDHYRIETIIQPIPDTDTTTVLQSSKNSNVAASIDESVVGVNDDTTTTIIPPSVPIPPNKQQQQQQQIRQRSFSQIISNVRYKTRGYVTRRNFDVSSIQSDGTDTSTRSQQQQQQPYRTIAGTFRPTRPIQKQPKQRQRRERIVVLPGAPKYEDDWARDSHDFFNLVALVPLVALNVMNWNWDTMFLGISKIYFQYEKYCVYHTVSIQRWLLQSYILIQSMITGTTSIINNNTKSNTHYTTYNPKDDISFTKVLENSWTGEWFQSFFYFTVFYFIIDLFWVYAVPQAVRSPSTIIQHHIATILYITIPYWYTQCRWCMGACMIVEINTWFLIARRVFNKQGFPPWTIVDFSFLSIRIKIISIMFYTSWITIRCLLYPSLLGPFYTIWRTHSKQIGQSINFIGLCIPLHTIFCILNIKWTYELLMSKIRYWRRLHALRKSHCGDNNAKAIAELNYVSKGL